MSNCRPSNSPTYAGRSPGFDLLLPVSRLANIFSLFLKFIPNLLISSKFSHSFFISPSKLVCDALINIFLECDMVPGDLLLGVWLSVNRCSFSLHTVIRRHFLLQTAIFAKLRFDFEPLKNLSLKKLNVDSYLN